MLLWFLFHQPFRRWLLKLSGHLPKKLEYWLLEKLYPDDCVIIFKE